MEAQAVRPVLRRLAVVEQGDGGVRSACREEEAPAAGFPGTPHGTNVSLAAAISNALAGLRAIARVRPSFRSGPGRWQGSRSEVVRRVPHGARRSRSRSA